MWLSLSCSGLICAVNPRKSWWLLLVLLPGTVGVLCICYQRAVEPRYQGKPLSDWVSRADAETPVVTIGTNALPYLIKWIQYRSPAWTPKVLPSFVQQFLSRRMELANGSIAAFGVLRDIAIPAIPELLQLVNAKNFEVGRRASMVISAMRDSVTHGDPAVTIPPLIEASDSPDPLIATCATRLLCDIVVWHGPELHLDAVLAALIRNVGATNQSVRDCAIRGLGNLGRSARAALPALESAAINDPVQFNRQDATNSLRRIGKEHLPHAPSE
jgi:hypothetical protein